MGRGLRMAALAVLALLATGACTNLPELAVGPTQPDQAMTPTAKFCRGGTERQKERAGSPYVPCIQLK